MKRTIMAAGVMLAAVVQGGAQQSSIVTCDVARSLVAWHAETVVELTERMAAYARVGDTGGVEELRAQLASDELPALVYLARLQREACGRR